MRMKGESDLTPKRGGRDGREEGGAEEREVRGERRGEGERRGRNGG